MSRTGWTRLGALVLALVAACLAVATGPAPAAGFLEGTHEGADFSSASPPAGTAAW